MDLKDNSKLKEIIKNIGGGLLVIFVPGLSPLYIASYKYGIDSEECEKELKRLSKKLVKINYRLTGRETQTDSKELFCEICKQMDSLSLKELKVLRKFCNAIDKQNGLDLRIHRHEDKIIDFISKHRNIIDEYIDSKKAKCKNNKYEYKGN